MFFLKQFSILLPNKTLLIILGISVFFSMCDHSQEYRIVKTANIVDTYHMEVRTADSIVLLWNPPPLIFDTVLFYQLYYKELESDSEWELCKDSISASESPTTTVYRNNIRSTATEFYFSISYITKKGRKSEVHYSTDKTASPRTGWFLKWDLRH